MNALHGTMRDGTPITDSMVTTMADEAERGYDVEDVLRRRAGRPTMGVGPASTESVRLDPAMKRALLLQAAADGISVSETIRRALSQYLKAG